MFCVILWGFFVVFFVVCFFVVVVAFVVVFEVEKAGKLKEWAGCLKG